MARVAQSEDDEPFSPGTKLGKYELLATIGKGGMAKVILARQRGIGGFERPVVIKVIHPHMASDKGAVNMLLDEARLAAQIVHHNVVQTYELDQAHGTFYIVMEYLAGESLLQVFRRAARRGIQVPPRYAAHLIANVCEGLQAAHEAVDVEGSRLGIIHRDISPGNLVVLYSGSVKIVDFGIAKAHGRVTNTEDGKLKGKFGYMPPEQISKEPMDRRSDLFSLGVVLWEALTLRRCFHAESVGATLMQILRAPRVAPSQINRDVPPELDAIVLKALAIDPRDRFQSAAEMQRALVDIPWPSRCGTAEISEYMTGLFSDRIEQRRALLARTRHDDPRMLEILASLEDEPDVATEGVIELRNDRDEAATVPRGDRHAAAMAPSSDRQEAVTVPARPSLTPTPAPRSDRHPAAKVSRAASTPAPAPRSDRHPAATAPRSDRHDAAVPARPSSTTPAPSRVERPAKVAPKGSRLKLWLLGASVAIAGTIAGVVGYHGGDQDLRPEAEVAVARSGERMKLDVDPTEPSAAGAAASAANTAPAGEPQPAGTATPVAPAAGTEPIVPGPERTVDPDQRARPTADQDPAGTLQRAGADKRASATSDKRATSTTTADKRVSDASDKPADKRVSDASDKPATSTTGADQRVSDDSDKPADKRVSDASNNPETTPTESPAPVDKPAGASAEALDALYRKATSSHLAGQFSAAADSFAQIIKLDPRHAAAHRGLGIATQAMGHNARAVAAFRAYLALRPDARDADAIRARINSLQGD